MKRSSPLIALSLLICTIGIRIVYAQPRLTILHLSRAQEPKPFPLQRSDEKVISRRLYVNDPVDIDNLSVKGIKIELNRKFSASSIANEGGGLEEDWLENLAFSVTNKTEKRITYLFISFQFPLFTENPHTQAGIYYQIILGVDPRATGTAGTYAEPFSLAAGDSHTIMLVDKDLNEIKKRLTMGKRSLADFNRMFILIPTVGYEDGTQWKLGKDSRPEKVQQSDDKEVEIASYDNEPYEINDLTVKNVKLHPGWSYSDPEESFVRRIKQSYKFSARSVAGDGGGREEDWLENLQFSVKNNSDKKVNYIGLSIQFPETTVNGPLMVDNSLNLGIRPSDSPEWASKKIPLSLGPADSVTLTLSAQNLKSIKDFLALRKFQLSGLNKAVIRMEEIYYLDDSIMWLTGSYYRPSTTTPGRYERIDK